MIERSKTVRDDMDPSIENHILPAREAGIATSNLSAIRPDGQLLFQGLNLSVSPGEILGIIGDEGVGKSTLLKILAGTLGSEFSVSGTFQSSDSGYFTQFLDPEWSSVSVFEYFFKEHPEEEMDPSNWNEYANVAKSLGQVGLAPDTFLGAERTMGSLSGGECSRVRMAKLLFQGKQTLLLDEPTNNLDIETIEWLEGFLTESSLSVVLVSHDEVFLENVTNQILYLQRSLRGKDPLHRYSGNGYKALMDSFAAEAEQSAREEARFKKEQRDQKSRLLEDRVKSESKFKKQKPQDAAAKGRQRRGMANATSQRKRVQNSMERQKAPERLFTNEEFSLPIPPNCEIPRNKSILSIKDMDLRHGDVVVARNVSVDLRGPRQVIIQGPNGAGKTTLIKSILDTLQVSGDPTLRVGYLPQDYFSKRYSPTETVLSLAKSDKVDESDARALLARLGLDAKLIDQHPNNLSSGQLCKTFIASIILMQSNVLILDEPTNNLYPLTGKALRSFLKAFPGCLIAVSHDRKFIQDIGDDIYYFTPGKPFKI